MAQRSDLCAPCGDRVVRAVGVGAYEDAAMGTCYCARIVWLALGCVVGLVCVLLGE
jgi:hypothetical protein